MDTKFKIPMKTTRVSILALLFCLLSFPQLGFAAKGDFLTDPATAQGYLVWEADNRANVTYQVRLTEKNRRGQVVQVKHLPDQSENYFHFTRQMRSHGKHWSAQVKISLNGAKVGLSDIIDIGPLPELDDDVYSELQCSWVCPGMGYQIDSYCMSNAPGAGCYGYIMELMSSQTPYYTYMYYDLWSSLNPFGLIDDYHVVHIGGVDYADGYCHNGVALDGNIVGVLVENPYGLIQTTLLTGSNPCVLYTGPLSASVPIENYCVNCDPNLDILCNVSGDCVGGGSSSTSNSGGSNGPTYDWIDSLFFAWIYDIDPLDDDGVTGGGGGGGKPDFDFDHYMHELTFYDPNAGTINVFGGYQKHFKHALSSTVKRVTLHRMDAATNGPVKLSVGQLDAQNPNSMEFTLDLSNKPAGLYNLFIQLENGHFMRRIFAHKKKQGPVKKTGDFVFGGPGLELFPNPASDRITANVFNADGPAVLTILDLNGRQKMERVVELNSAQESVEFALEQFAAGVYFLQLEVNGHRETQKFIVR